MLYRVGGDVADRAVEFTCRPDVLPRDLDCKFRETLEKSARRYALEELYRARDRVAWVDCHEEMNVVGHYFEFDDFEVVVARNLLKEHLAGLFNERLIEYRSSVFGHEDYVVGQLSKAMAVVIEFHLVSMWRHERPRGSAARAT